MTAIIKNGFRTNNADVYRASMGTQPTYMVLGRPTPWVATPEQPTASDSTPPIPTDNVNGDYSVSRHGIGAKIIQLADTSLGILRWDWKPGTVYAEYNAHIPDLMMKNFYVVTDEFNVYKCLDNNKGVVSAIKPTGTGTTTISTADGYKWKFMYAVSAADSEKFATNQFIPVKRIDTPDGSLQSNVQNTAVVGTITNIAIINAGSGYTTAPTVAITGNGTGATAVATVVAGAITSVRMTNVGSGYTTATVTLTPTSGGSGGALVASLSPFGGHGTNAAEELGGYYALFSTSFEYDEGGAISTKNDFRSVSIVRNPVSQSNTAFVASVANLTTKITAVTTTGAFQLDEILSQISTGATGNIVEIGAGFIRVTNSNGKFAATGVLKGATSLAEATPSAVTLPDFKENGFRVHYIEHRKPVYRADDQREKIVIVVEW